MTDVRKMGYAAIIIAVIDGTLTSEEAEAELKRRARQTRVTVTRAPRTHLAASAPDDEQ